VTTIRQNIIDYLETLLATIPGISVYPWRVYATGAYDMPCIVVKDENENISEDDYSYTEERVLEISIDINTTGTDCLDKAREFAGIVYQYLGSDMTAGGNCVNIQYVNNELELIHGEELIASMSMTFNFTYNIKKFNEDVVSYA